MIRSLLTVRLFICLTLFLSSCLTTDKQFEETIVLTKVRNIGHLILLSSGDSQSRVFPSKVNENTYKIAFESPFLPHVDSVISISQRIVENEKPFTIELWETKKHQLVNSFLVSTNAKENILPCASRPLAKSKYEIILRFQDVKENKNPFWILGGFLLLLILGGYVVFSKVRSRKSKKLTNILSNTSSITIGETQFYALDQRLVFGDVIIELTGKETHILSILSENKNEVVERNRLQKEIWEDQGIIVNRSLDIYISRLRKKLSIDDSVKIINVHGIGYKLVVEK